MHALKKNRPLRRIVLTSAATVSGVVLLLSLKPHTAPALASPSPSPSPSTGAVASPAPSGSASNGAATGTRTATGEAAQTRYGPVQVRVTVKDGRLTDVTAVTYPQSSPRDQRINGYAVPLLGREALSAQSANIDAVSGATYTSEGYRQSLQSALDSLGR
ncbi:FMN-binding protein [Streptomyces sp. KM273126]|uniref:FMN-binding protein n=1 Tax=Streptomyces sp. KM273126 TaxID=2545247 RepID=UPI00103F13E4|nr:FMN-binding protein [Streptomyces sp. KM273126]MBA2812523.1 FMN-binding protein [Streptomyces sp. KM273126]